jgi:hypothetical protein
MMMGVVRAEALARNCACRRDRSLHRHKRYGLPTFRTGLAATTLFSYIASRRSPPEGLEPSLDALIHKLRAHATTRVRTTSSFRSR